MPRQNSTWNPPKPIRSFRQSIPVSTLHIEHWTESPFSKFSGEKQHENESIQTDCEP
jgi:hypothetical protein